MNDNIEEVTDRMRHLLNHSITSMPAIIAAVGARDDWSRVGFNIQTVSRSALSLGMLKKRVDRDSDAAIQAFLVGASYAPKLADLYRKGTDLEPGIFEAPIYCCLLAGQLQAAQELSAALSTKPLPKDASWFDVSAYLLATFVLNDRAQFDRVIQLYERFSRKHRQLIFNIYAKQCSAVLSGNQAEFTQLLCDADLSMRQRKTDTAFGEELIEYGGLRNNRFVLDFMSIGISVVAVTRGLTAELDTEYFPLDLFHEIEMLATKAAQHSSGN